MRIALTVGIFLALLASLTACAVGPRYARPQAQTPPGFKEAPPGWTTAQPSDQIARGKWWEVFNDPQLNTLEETINVSNQTLKAAEAQYTQARARSEERRVGKECRSR